MSQRLGFWFPFQPPPQKKKTATPKQRRGAHPNNKAQRLVFGLPFTLPSKTKTKTKSNNPKQPPPNKKSKKDNLQTQRRTRALRAPSASEARLLALAQGDGLPGHVPRHRQRPELARGVHARGQHKPQRRVFKRRLERRLEASPPFRGFWWENPEN